MSTILVIAKVLTATVVTAAATYVVSQVVAQDVPVTPIEILLESKTGSLVTSKVADSVRSCSEPATGGNTEGSDDLCITVDGLMVDTGRALTTTGAASSGTSNSADAIAEAIRQGMNGVAAAPLSAGPNGRAS